MDEFEELSGSEATAPAPAPALVDPASEFLEREKEELGDVLGETQGVKVLMFLKVKGRRVYVHVLVWNE